MMLHRYGGGASMDAIKSVLDMPINTVVRLMGSALAASGQRRAPGSDRNPDTEADILKQLDAKAREAGANI